MANPSSPPGSGNGASKGFNNRGTEFVDGLAEDTWRTEAQVGQSLRILAISILPGVMPNVDAELVPFPMEVVAT